MEQVKKKKEKKPGYEVEAMDLWQLEQHKDS
jgi:hypothetical protein